MRIQLRLNEVGLGRLSVMIHSRRKVSDVLETVERTESKLWMIKLLQWQSQKVLKQWLRGYLSLMDVCVSRRDRLFLCHCESVYEEENEKDGGRRPIFLYCILRLIQCQERQPALASPLDLSYCISCISTWDCFVLAPYVDCDIMQCLKVNYSTTDPKEIKLSPCCVLEYGWFVNKFL